KKREVITDVFKRMEYYSSETKILYYTSDNRVLKRTGGTRSWRLNNPGNIDFAGTTNIQKGRIGKAFIPGQKKNDGAKFPDHYAAVFESYEAGCKAQVDLLRRKYRFFTISQMTKKYAPDEDNNDSEAYAKELLSVTGVSPTTTFENMTDEEIEKIAYTMRVKEGFYNTNIPYTEEWLETTNILVSDGKRSITNYPFKVTLGDKTYDWVTNTVGKLPTIFHIADGMIIEIKENNLTGKENTVYKAIAGEQTKNILLKKNSFHFTAYTLPEQSSPPKERNQPESIIYTVQSDDISLDSIAMRYDVSTSDLAKDNGIRENTEIYPGQQIIIYNKSGTLVDTRENLPWKQTGKSYSVPEYPSRQVEVVRGKNSGDALGLIPVIPDEAPWMTMAISELTKFHEVNKSIIESVTDYNSEVTNKKASMKTQAWCAAFVNYCLYHSDYPMWAGPTIAVNVCSSANFVRIEKPVWGCIVYLTISHATFFYGYAKNVKNSFIGLGGNQHATIRFSSFPLSQARFYLPAQYAGEHRKYRELGIYDVRKLNE
ncbi:LysM peptidoglycan-binding domain-containing protein, partial [Salmonella enterica]|nr:LysM peptidoglycan-binding domain-containing protein [Salmonella enterica]